MAWAPIALAVASAASQYMANESAKRRQQSLTDAMTAYRSQRSANAQQTIDQFLKEQTPEARAAQQTGVQNELQTGLQNSVGAVQKFQAPQTIAGKLSPDYTNRVASDAAGVKDRITAAIQQLSGIGTPSEVGMINARRYGQAATDVDAQQRAGINVAQRYQDAIGMQRPDPYLSFASALFQGASIASGSGGSGSGALTSPYSLAGSSAGGTGIKGLRLSY